MKQKFGKVSIKDVVKDAVGDVRPLKVSKEDYAEALLKLELPKDTFVNYQEIMPNMPEDIELLKPAREFLLYCRKIAKQFLDATEYLKDAESGIDSLDCEILIAERQLKNNALKFYKAFHLQEKLRERCKKKKVDSTMVFKELMCLLAETECHIIYVYEQRYDDVTSIEELKCKLGLEELQEDAAEEFYGYYTYFNKKNDSLGKCISDINNECDSLSIIKKKAKHKVLDILCASELDIYRKLFDLLCPVTQEWLCCSAYTYEDSNGWKTRGYVCGMIEGYLEALLCGWSNEKFKQEVKEGLGITMIFGKFMDELSELVSKDEQYIQADQKEKCNRLMEFAKQLM